MTLLTSVSTEPCTSALMIRLIVLTSRGLDRGQEVVARDAVLAGQLGLRECGCRAPRRSPWRGPVVDDEELVAGAGQVAQAADDDRRGRAGFLDHARRGRSSRLRMRPKPAPRDDDVADVQRAILHEHGRDRAQARDPCAIR